MRRQPRAQVSPLSGSVRLTYFAPFLGGDHRSLPPHLQRAWKILSEAGLPVQQARLLVHNSVVRDTNVGSG
jgi:hypothetical protein